MVGGGPFGLRPGEWTDDTSMALCLATSLVECGGFDARDQMERYCRWADAGYLSSNGRCFDIGMTVSAALRRYRETGNPFSGDPDPRKAGNGSLMRLAPIALFYHPDRDQVRHFAAESSRTTHAAPECLDACRYFSELLSRALAGESKEEILFTPNADFTPTLTLPHQGGGNVDGPRQGGGNENDPDGDIDGARQGGGNNIEARPSLASRSIANIAAGRYRTKTREQIRGTGYVVDCLEAALWCFERTTSFRDAILEAANLGDDADTTAAVCGQIAGAFYGVEGIPKAWRERLVMADEIAELADRLRQQPVTRQESQE
jgi:ADP-ribosyl-[dinitrogen reductase] hydrolase